MHSLTTTLLRQQRVHTHQHQCSQLQSLEQVLVIMCVQSNFWAASTTLDLAGKWIKVDTKHDFSLQKTSFLTQMKHIINFRVYEQFSVPNTKNSTVKQHFFSKSQQAKSQMKNVHAFIAHRAAYVYDLLSYHSCLMKSIFITKIIFLGKVVFSHAAVAQKRS